MITVLGSLLHFTYAWSGRNKFVAIFSAVNESTWEHIKLALSAIFACTMIDVWFLGTYENYWLAKSVALLTPIIVIPLIFYSYTAVTKKPILAVDISSFVVAAFLSSLVMVLILQALPIGEWQNLLSMGIALVILAAYLLLTRFPWRGNLLFRDPITGKYGYGGETRHPKRSLRRSGRSARSIRKAGGANSRNR